jgi:hypothetical protein
MHGQQNVKNTAMIVVALGNKKRGNNSISNSSSSSSSRSSKHYLDIHFCTLMLIRTGQLPFVIVKQAK